MLYMRKKQFNSLSTNDISQLYIYGNSHWGKIAASMETTMI